MGFQITDVIDVCLVPSYPDGRRGCSGAWITTGAHGIVCINTIRDCVELPIEHMFLELPGLLGQNRRSVRCSENRRSVRIRRNRVNRCPEIRIDVGTFVGLRGFDPRLPASVMVPLASSAIHARQQVDHEFPCIRLGQGACKRDYALATAEQECDVVGNDFRSIDLLRAPRYQVGYGGRRPDQDVDEDNPRKK